MLNYINMLEIFLWYKFTFHLHDLFKTYFLAFQLLVKISVPWVSQLIRECHWKLFQILYLRKMRRLFAWEAIKHYITSYCMLFILKWVCKELGTLYSLCIQLVIFILKQHLKHPVKWKLFHIQAEHLLCRPILIKITCTQNLNFLQYFMYDVFTIQLDRFHTLVFICFEIYICITSFNFGSNMVFLFC